MTKKIELTDKQKRFADEYIIDLNATQAAIRAGYSQKTANEQGARLLANVSVQEYIQAKQRRLEVRTEITQDYVLNGLKKIYERCMQEEPVNDKDGNFTGVFKFEAAGANRSIELLGKHLGMFSDKLKVSQDENGKPVQVDHHHTVSGELILSRIADLVSKGKGH